MANFSAEYPVILGVSGSGTVTSVAMSVPAFLSVTGSPITTAGTLAVSLSGTALPVTSGGTGHTSLSNFTDSSSGADGITVTGGSGAVVVATSIVQAASSASQNGYLSSTDWTTFNNKGSGSVTSVAMTVPAFLSISGSPVTTTGTLAVGFSGTALPIANGGTAQTSLGNLTDAGTDGITVTGGTGALITSASLSQHVADTTHNGYLSSTDWNTFNGKQAAGSYITALTGDGTAAGPGSVALTLSTVNSNVGSFGSSTAVPSFTVNGKGLITAASSQQLALGGLASQATHTLLGNATGGSASPTALTAVQTKAFLNTAPTVQSFTPGSGTYTTPTNPSPLYIKVQMVGGGGGGAGGGAGGGSGSNGNDSTFGTSLLTASKGLAPVSNAGGLGGAATVNSPAVTIAAVAGGNGSAFQNFAMSSGSTGGGNAWGGNGGGGVGGATGSGGTNGQTGTGAGGGGGGGSATNAGGAAGGASGYVEAIISPSATYSYTAGAGGSGGAAGTNGGAGGNGGGGYIVVSEFYQ